MKTKKQSRFFAVFLSLVMILTILPSMPAEAAASDVFKSLKSDKENSEGVAYYWTGEEFVLTATVVSQGYTIDWEVPSGISKVGTTTQKAGSDSTVLYSQKFKIADDCAADTYTVNIKATKGGVTESYPSFINVQEGKGICLDQVKKTVYTGQSTFSVPFLFDANLKGYQVTSSDPSVLSISNSTISKETYPGCIYYQAAVSVADTLGGEMEKNVDLIITATKTDGSQDVHRITYSVKKSFEKIDSIKVKSASNYDSVYGTEEEYNTKYPHVDTNANVIYLDKGELTQFEVTCTGSDVDGLLAAFSGGKDSDYFETFTGYDSGEEISSGTKKIIFAIKPKKGTPVNGNQTIIFTSESGVVSKTFKAVFYDTSNLSKYVIEDNTGNTGGQVMQPGETVQLKTKNADAKEEILWESSDTSIAVVDANGKVSAKSNGTARITGTIKPTLSGPRAQNGIPISHTYTVTVRKIVYPQKLVVTKESSNGQPIEAISETVEKGTELQFGYQATRTDGTEVNYDTYVWKTGNSQVATVDANGKLTAVGKGETTLWMEPKDAGVGVISNKVTIKVYAPITAIQVKDEFGRIINNQQLVSEGQSVILEAVRNSEASTSEAIIWQTSDDSVAVVGEPGKPNNMGASYTGDTCLVTFKSTTSVVTISAKAVRDNTKNFNVNFEVNQKIPAKRVLITESEHTFNAQKVTPITLTAEQYSELTGTDLSNETLIWSTDAADVFDIKQNQRGTQAVITAKKAGRGNIYVKTASGVISAAYPMESVIYATKINLSQANATLAIGEELKLVPTTTPYNCTEQLSWTVDGSGITLKENGDGSATIKATANTGASPCKVIVKAMNSEKSATCTISVKNAIASCKVEGIPTNAVYNGTAIKPEVSVYAGDGTLLTLNVHYSVSYGRNIDAGEGTIILTGKGEYLGKKELTFKIAPASITKATFGTVSKMTYTGKEQTPRPSVKLMLLANGKETERTLVNNRDYTFSYQNNKNAGKMTVIAKGTGNYTGSVSQTYDIEPKEIPRPSLKTSSYDYADSAIQPEMTLKFANQELVKNVDYTVSVKNNKKIGQATVTVKGKGNFTGTQECKFTIRARNIGAKDAVKAQLSVTDYIYNGKAKKPKVTITYKVGTRTVTLKSGRDYKVTYMNNQRKSTAASPARVTITGKGNYTGTLNIPFYITEKVKVSKANITSAKNSKAKSIVMKMKKVSGAKGYEIAYSTSKKFTESTTVTKTTSKTTYTIKKLKKGKTYYVRVRAYKLNSANRKAYGSWSSVKKVKINK